MNKKINFFIFSIKKMLISISIVLFTICLVVFSKTNLNASKIGLNLWANSIVPSILPFFIATELLSHTNIIPIFGKLLKGIMKPIFNVTR